MQIRFSKAQRVNGMRDIKSRCQGRVEVVNMLAISHDAISMGNVEIARHLVYLHAAPDIAPLPRVDSVEGDGTITLTLGAVAEDGADVPLLGLVGSDELIAGIAASKKQSIRIIHY